MGYPFAEVKARVSLEDLLRDDGIAAKRSGSRLMCLSPFNAEKTPSCSIDLARGRFKCFSSGHSGDIFDYYTLTRNCSMEQAREDLAARAGLAMSDGRPRPFVPVKRSAPAPEEKKPLVPIAGQDLLVWREGVTTLLGTLSLQMTIADWRGFQLHTIKAMAEASLMGVVRIGAWLRTQDEGAGDRRVAFAVQAPARALTVKSDAERETVAYHVRLKPKFEGDKASWRYLPWGLGAWPFVLGRVAEAKFLIICEGQWDAMAVFDSLNAGSVAELASSGVAVVGMRGAHNWPLFAEHELLAGATRERVREALVDKRVPDELGRLRRVKNALRPELQVLLLCDGDKAGHLWASRAVENEPSFAEVLQVVAGQVRVLEPREGMEGGLGKDVNEVLKGLRAR